jgi:hypothetical protein
MNACRMAGPAPTAPPGALAPPDAAASVSPARFRKNSGPVRSPAARSSFSAPVCRSTPYPPTPLHRPRRRNSPSRPRCPTTGDRPRQRPRAADKPATLRDRLGHRGARTRRGRVAWRVGERGRPGDRSGAPLRAAGAARGRAQRSRGCSDTRAHGSRARCRTGSTPAAGVGTPPTLAARYAPTSETQCLEPPNLRLHRSYLWQRNWFPSFSLQLTAAGRRRGPRGRRDA